ncbi:MAG: DUF1294 domain-containing protein [Akkermansiaceae bacterium]|nr:DUF1294 domain-containing protein [Akkermansiaceae bacterium]
MSSTDQFQPFQTPTRRVGTILQWEDAKGYGWVKSGSKLWFLHIKEFNRAERRPRLGEEVTFILGIDSKGRNCAKLVTFVNSGGRVGFGAWVLLVSLLVLPGLAILMLPFPLCVLWALPGSIVAISALTFRMYAHDKQQALAGGWRVAEKSLHLAELFGGWPGAFLAQRQQRHKCSKVSYLIVFWGIVAIHQIVAVDVLMDHRLSNMLIDYVLEP